MFNSKFITLSVPASVGSPPLSGLGFSGLARVVYGLSRSEHTVLWSIFSFKVLEFPYEIKLTWSLNTHAFQGDKILLDLPFSCLSFLHYSCFLLLRWCLVIMGLRLWGKSSLRTKEIGSSKQAGWPFLCVTLANSQSQVSQSGPTLVYANAHKSPLGTPCSFPWDLVFSRHLSMMQPKSPHHKQNEPLKTRSWDLPISQGLWCVAMSAALGHVVVSRFVS